jgi:HEAT repeat protein
VTPLARLLADADDLVAMAAAGSLARIGPGAENAILPLVHLLRSGRPGLVRAAAADALGAIGPRASTAGPVLRRIAADSDEDPRVRSAAAAALDRIGP